MYAFNTTAAGGTVTNQPDPIAMLEQIYEHTERVLAEVRPEQYPLPTPCTEWNVRQLLNHMIGSVHGMASAVAGEAPTAGDPPDFMATSDPAGQFRLAAERSLAAWRGDGALDGPVRLGPLEMPGHAALELNKIDILTHSWDVGEAIGAARSVDPSVAEAVLAAAHLMIADEMRGAMFAPEVAIAQDAPAFDRLAAFLGRQPA
jgi:uncharacterized protein (TIGR03086 family)